MCKSYCLAALLLISLATRPLLATDSTGARPGTWTYDLSAAKALADSTDRPLLVKFSNSSGKCVWCNKFASEIDASDTWNAYASEQQLAMAYIDYNHANWDEDYYLSFYSTTSKVTDVTGFPAFVIYASDGTNVLSAFSFGSTNITFTAAAFTEKVDGVLENNSYQISGDDLWDPADNTAVGATILDFKSFNQRQYHDLNKLPTDTSDWFKFLCVSGRRYLLNVPAIDYKIVFKATNTVGTTTNRTSTSVTASLPVLVPSNTVGSSAFMVTNTLATVTNFFVESFDVITNSLPWFEQLSSATNYSAPSSFSYTNATRETVTTNLPGRKIAFTNGTPPSVISPSFTIWDPARQTALPFETGAGVATNALLSALTNGCVFTPAAAFNNSYCFAQISQTIDSAPPSFNVVEHDLPQTNLTVVTATTNFADGAAITRTITNIWSFVTYSGPTNLLVPAPFPDYRPALLITSNRLTEVFRDTFTNALLASQTLVTTNASVSEGSNYVTYAYDRSSYRLNYRIWTPGEVGFAATNVQAAESAASVSLTVTRKGGTSGELRLRYGCSDLEAEDGKDYAAVEGELFWADGQAGSTSIVVSLIQDLRPTWEGNERFAVSLRKHEGASLQAPLNAWSNAAVTLKESAAIKPGTFGFSGSGDGEEAEPFASPAKPAVTVKEGEAVTLWVARTGGSNGVSRVRVTTVSGTAASPADFDALSETLEWADNDGEPKRVTLQTAYRDPFNRDASLTVKLAGLLNAPLSATAASAAVTLRDQSVALGLADTEASAASRGAAFKAASGYWFWSDAETLRCESPTRAGSQALTLTLTGPGLLTFDWSIAGWAAQDKLTCSGGVVAPQILSGDGGSSWVLVKPGRQSVTWVFTKASPVDASLDDHASLANLVWHPMTRASVLSPPNLSRTRAPDFSWTLPDSAAVRLGGDFDVDEADTLPQTTTVSAVSPAGSSVPDVLSAAFSELWPGASLVAGRTYRWRVDTVLEHEGSRLVYAGDTWSFTALNPEGSGDTGLPPEGLNGDAYEARQGVRCDFGEISASADGALYAVVGGALPPGLTLSRATGRISGVPTKAGTWTHQLQATAAGVPYTSASVTIRVYPLGAFAGTYDGWSATNTPPESCGAATVTLTESGSWSAKISAGGTTYSFSKAGFDETTDGPAEPSALVGAAYGAVFAAADGRYTNTLAVTLDAEGAAYGTLTVYALTGSGATATAVPTVFDLELHRNNWSEGHMLPVLSAFKGYYTVALPVSAAENPDNTPWGSGYVALTVGDKGSVKLTGLLADGQSWSASSVLLMPDTNDTATAAIYVYFQPAAYNKNGALTGWLRISLGDSLYENTVDCPESDQTLKWWNRTPTCVSGAEGSAATGATGFFNDLAAAGGFYDTVMNLQTFYRNRALSFTDNTDFPGSALLDRLPADNDGKDGTSGYLLLDDDAMLPFGANIVVGAQSLSVGARKLVTNDLDRATHSMTDYIELDESSNVAGLTLSLTRATGLFSGTFDLVYERENANGAFVRRTRKVTHRGIYTPVRPGRTAEDSNEGLQGSGFYLIPDTGSYLDNTGRTKTYSFSWSFAFDLLSSASSDE